MSFLSSSRVRSLLCCLGGELTYSCWRESCHPLCYRPVDFLMSIRIPVDPSRQEGTAQRSYH
jgi:hypothetical protein